MSRMIGFTQIAGLLTFNGRREDVNDVHSQGGTRLLAEARGFVRPTFRKGFASNNAEESFVKSAKWTSDGTSILTNSSDNCIRTYIIPPDLLEQRSQPIALHPYSAIASVEPVDAVVAYPEFDLQEPSTALVLSALNEHPIRLNSALTSCLVASYPLVSPTTEAYIKPSSLLFAGDGSRFVCGSNSLLSTFDLARPGQGPISTIRTGPKNSKSSWNNPVSSMRGIISALAVDQQYNVLAAGTLSRHVGLYDAAGQGECVGVFSIQGTAADTVIGGTGITKVLWSPCGQYLYIAERKSEGVMVYDIRKSGQLLCWLEGRKADTNQRFNVELEASGEGADHRIWAGGIDGVARSWSNPHHNEGGIQPSVQQTVHEDAVSSISMHRNGGVLATASGQRHFDNATGECSMKIWSL